MTDVIITECRDYSEKEISLAMMRLLETSGGLDWVESGMKIAVKVNLVTFLHPERAATTHPATVCELTRLLVRKGAQVTVGDSPGGIYNAAFVNRVYSVAGMKCVESVGGTLNRDFGQRTANYPQAKIAKSFEYTSYLDDCDAIIDFCKLKTHGMMGMSAAVKNMFGVVPGTVKPEYHYRFPDHGDFADMLIDINEYFRPKLRLCICDAVVGMEGNGPTAGVPRQIGALLASKSPYLLDIAAAHIIGQRRENIPTLEAAYRRGLAPAGVGALSIDGDIDRFVISDYDNIITHSALEFGRGALLSKLVGGLLKSRPAVDKRGCVGCGICADICPAKSIEINGGLAVIDRARCIRCFCCQEFCPKGAMKVKRTAVAKIANRKHK